MKKKESIFVLSFGSERSGITPVSNLISTLSQLFSSIKLITNGQSYDHFAKISNIEVFDVGHTVSNNNVLRMVKYALLQLKVVEILIKNNNDTSQWFFFIGGDTQILPMLFAKITGKPVNMMFAGSGIKVMSSKKDNRYVIIIARLMSKFTMRYPDRIIVYGISLIEEFALVDHKSAIHIASEHHIDLGVFKNTVPYSERSKCIGYVGRFSEEKGILEFARALPAIYNEIEDLKTIIIGSGSLEPAIHREVHKPGLENKIELTGWVEKQELNKYLNSMSLLVIPSFTEGLPNIMLEAMACGTPVLATPVGAIPDVICHGENGLLLSDNGSQTITIAATQLLQDRELGERISKNGIRYIKNHYSFEERVQRFSEILNKKIIIR